MTGQTLAEEAIAGSAPTIADIEHLPTVSVPVAGALLSLGRDASYAAAARGEIPTLKFGRSLRVPVPRLLALLGVDPQENSDAGPSPEPASASILTLAKEKTDEPEADHGPAPTRAASRFAGS